MVDHIAGSRRGQRQELPVEARLRFGRHPESDVMFDAHRDLDASSRHAELRFDGEAFTLIDIGSSNGTFVDGERVGQARIQEGDPVEVEFGAGGPRLRLFIGDDAAVAELPGIETSAAAQPAGAGRWLAIVAIVAAVAALAALMWWRLGG
ncbi:MAG TPA: FHA domain-containing protein [Kofleriaceae bacterium]|nr:FHA domain-containing protein [Kofleriaceae bacterium]